MKKMIILILMAIFITTTDLLVARDRYAPKGGPYKEVLLDSQPNSFLTNYGQRPLKRHVVPTFNDGFEFVSSGVAGGEVYWYTAEGTRVNDTDNYICGANGMKLTHPNNNVNQTLSATDLGIVDWSGCHIYIRYYVHPGTGAADPTGIRRCKLTLQDTDGDYKQFWIYTENATSHARSGDGWHEAFVTYENYFIESGTFNPSIINTVTINVETDAVDDTPVTTWDQFLVYPEPSKATVMLRLDDGYQQQYDMATYANKQGLLVTIGAIKEYIVAAETNPSAYLGLAELHRLQDAGNLIVNHTLTATGIDLSVLSDDDIRKEIVGMQQWMCENGFSRGSRILIVPANKLLNSQIGVIEELCDFVWFSETTQQEAASTVGGGLGTDYDRFYINAFAGQTSGRTATTLNNKLAQAITAKAVYCPYWHSDSEANYESHLDQIAIDYAAGNVTVTTPDMYINRN